MRPSTIFLINLLFFYGVYSSSRSLRKRRKRRQEGKCGFKENLTELLVFVKFPSNHCSPSGTLKINCSKDIKIQGIIGLCTSLEKVGVLFFPNWSLLTPNYWNYGIIYLFYIISHILQKDLAIADTIIAQGNTSACRISGLDRSTCLIVFLNLSSNDHQASASNLNPQLYIHYLFDIITISLKVESFSFFVINNL